MKLLCATLALAFLLTGCGPSERDVIGVYRLNVEGQQGSLEVKSDGTYVQTLKLNGQEPVTRTGKWSFGDWRSTGKMPGRLSSADYGPFVFLENAAAIENCPKCQAATYDLVSFQVQAGMMDEFLVEDPKIGTGYAK